jgi:dGTPase
VANQELWKRLLSEKRLGQNLNRVSNDTNLGRTEFDHDIDRIVFSSDFRRMKDKTQLFPFSPSDYTRVRLTHSMEVASVGRSLGRMVGKYLKEQSLLPKHLEPSDVGTIVSAACLAHDTGNPPFGHSGERSIQEWATRNFGDTDTNESWKMDFRYFEGNAQAFRIYTRLNGRNREGGSQLTYATLGALMKYPISSINRHQKYLKLLEDKDKEPREKPYSKFGYFNPEEIFYKKIFEFFEIRERFEGVYARHPLAYLVEAADDICYKVIDIEDGYRLKLLNFNEIVDAYTYLFGEKHYEFNNDSIRERDRINLVRARVINSLAENAFAKFKENFEAIESGIFSKDLIGEVLKHRDPEYKKNYKKSVDKLYNTDSVLSIEIAGFKIINGILEILTRAFITETELKSSEKVRKALDVAGHPTEYAFDSKEIKYGKSTKDLYLEFKYFAITDYVSGMTDTYAVDLYQKLTGISL